MQGSARNTPRADARRNAIATRVPVRPSRAPRPKGRRRSGRWPRPRSASHASAARERSKRGDGDMLAVDLKEAAQRGARVAAAEAVGAERDERRVDIGGDQLRIGAHIVGRRDDRAVARQAARRRGWCARGARDAAGSPLDLTRVARELAEAGRRSTPRTRRPSRSSSSARGRDHFAQDRARAEEPHSAARAVRGLPPSTAGRGR